MYITRLEARIYHINNIIIVIKSSDVAGAEDSMRILGVRWTSSLHWNAHVSEVLFSLARCIYAIRILLPLVGKSKTALIYDALVTSVLSYAGPLLVGMRSSAKNRIDRFCNRNHKLICGPFVQILIANF